MTKRTITCIVIVLSCVTGSLAQSRSSKRPAGVSMTPGYYFTIGMCRACLYPEWHDDAIRLFRAKGIRAVVGKGYENVTTGYSFAPIKAFEMRFDSNVGRDSDVLIQIELYVGPFNSEVVAMNALNDFPAVLSSIQRKRNRMEGSDKSGWPISRDERVRRRSGNSYEYGFFFIKGYRLLPKEDAQGNDWNSFWTTFSNAVSKHDRVALKRLMSSEADFFSGGGGENRDQWIQMISERNAWRELQRSVASGTMPYNEGRRPGRITRDRTLIFQLIGGRWRFVGVMGD